MPANSWSFVHISTSCMTACNALCGDFRPDMLPLPSSLIHCMHHSPCMPLRPSSRCPACACPSPWGNGSQHTPTAGTGARKRCGLIPHACPTPSGSLTLRTRTRTAARRPPYTTLTHSQPSPFLLQAGLQCTPSGNSGLRDASTWRTWQPYDARGRFWLSGASTGPHC